MSGTWKKCPRAEGWELDIGMALRGTVVRYDFPPYDGKWGARVNTSFLGHYRDLAEAKLQVESVIRRDMRGVLEDWERFAGAYRSAVPE
jgi:hypothetical protein